MIADFRLPIADLFIDVGSFFHLRSIGAGLLQIGNRQFEIGNIPSTKR